MIALGVIGTIVGVLMVICGYSLNTAIPNRGDILMIIGALLFFGGIVVFVIGITAHKDTYDDDEDEGKIAPIPNVFCGYCGTLMPADSSFCPECGATLMPPPPQEVFCAQCGRPILSNAKFCRHCGSKRI